MSCQNELPSRGYDLSQQHSRKLPTLFGHLRFILVQISYLVWQIVTHVSSELRPNYSGIG